MLLTFMFVLGCGSKDDTSANDTDTLVEPAAEMIDDDLDGFDSEEDCDDTDPEINPDAEEICDDIDNNCNDEVDENVTLTYFTDSDGDGFGDEEKKSQSCEPAVGQVDRSGDCDDTNANISPSAEEICDGIDNNCNDNIDEELLVLRYLDQDGDGFGTTEAEVCSEDINYADEANDCDDDNSEINPDAEEVCDDIDNNCDGNIDEDLALPQYIDGDADGHGDILSEVWDCEKIPGTIYTGGDCDDENDQIHPSSPDLCNAIDDNCDGIFDNEPIPGATSIYLDADGDGFGDPNTTQQICSIPCMSGEDCQSPVIGYVFSNSDCNDNDSTIHIDAEEVCDSIDQNCNNIIDDNPVDGQSYYLDLDGDGYGFDDTETIRCAPELNEVQQAGDCNDGNSTAYPNAPEVCDLIDNDCDELIDDEDSILLSPTVWYQDFDNDGYGDEIFTIANTNPNSGCIGPIGYVANDLDCNDSDENINPSEEEICDEIDNNCDTFIDEGVIILWYLDNDEDGFGDDISALASCDNPSEDNSFVSEGGDCDDDDANVFPDENGTCPNN